jgi:hypothetical protein
MDDNLYQDFDGSADEPQRQPPQSTPEFAPHLEGVQAGHDVLVSGGDIRVTNYVAELAHLRPHLIDRGAILGSHLFVEPPVHYGKAPAHAFPGVASLANSVRVLLGREASGRRTAALRMLDLMLPAGHRIFELFPDWEEPDVARLPSEPETGYLLNLSGVQEPLGERFHEQLDEYARRVAAQDTKLVVVVGEHVWNKGEDSGRTGPVTVLRVGRPDVRKVALRRIGDDAHQAGRMAWLQDTSGVFAGLLSGDEPPVEGVRLAEIILQATSVHDAQARDRFLGWEERLAAWFGSSDGKAPEHRALQIAAAFLDGSPARSVLDAADALLADSGINWPARQGGPLAGADDTQRCAVADVDFAVDGTVSISKPRPGIDRALLRHVWRKRPQLVPILTRWLCEISKPGGIADGSLGRLAESLTYIAESEGPSAVLDLTHDWLLTGKARHVDLAVDVLDRLSVEQSLGSSVRKELSAWAKAVTRPERQRAVVAVCRGRLGREYTSIALTRLRYVLDRARDPQVRQEAEGALRELLTNELVAARVLQTLVEWGAGQDVEAPSRETFLKVFVPDTAAGAADPTVALLTAEGPEGRVVRQLLKQGWRTVWRRPAARGEAANVLGSWCDAADEGDLPAEAVEEIVAVVFTEEADSLGDDLDKVIGGGSVFRKRLRARFVDVVRETAARRSATDTGQAA